LVPSRPALQRLVTELIGRLYPYLVAAFSYNLGDDQIINLRAAGMLVFQHCLGPAVYAAIVDLTPLARSDTLAIRSSSTAVALSTARVSMSWKKASVRSVRDVSLVWVRPFSQPPESSSPTAVAGEVISVTVVRSVRTQP
jgi:hypothetical protein